MGQSKGRLTDRVLSGLQGHIEKRNSEHFKRFFTFREKGKEENLICGTDDSYGSPLPLNFLYSSEELHLN